MLKNLRRLTRKKLFLHITISVKNVTTGVMLPDSFAGHITDMTKHGACLLVNKIMAGSFHLFHSTRENDLLILQLTISDPHDGGQHTVNAHPLWFDLFHDKQLRGFKIGVTFPQPPAKEFIHAL
jgi:hypothetical protein